MYFNDPPLTVAEKKKKFFTFPSNMNISSTVQTDFQSKHNCSYKICQNNTKALPQTCRYFFISVKEILKVPLRIRLFKV